MSWISTLTCLGIPLLIFLVARRAWIQNRERAVLRTQHPDEQWLWRRDWASRTALDGSHSYVAFYWLIAAFWSLTSMPVLFVMRDRRDDPFFLFFATFPLIGVVLIGVALYQTLRRRKYGLSTCRFDALPIPLGRVVHGEVQTRVEDVPQEGFTVRLTCVRRIVTSSGKSTSTSERILWQEEQRVGAGAAMPGPNGVRVPFKFALPADGEEADERNPRDRVLWRLEIAAEVPGIDYRAAFELPVFTRSALAPESFPVAQAPWSQPPNIRFHDDTITINASATAFDWVFFVVFVILWYGVLYGMWRFGVPAFIPIFFALFGAVVFYFTLDRMTGRSVVTANRSQLTSRRTFFGTRVLPATEVESIQPRVGTTTGKRALYDVEARLRDGRGVTIARHLRGRRDAEEVAKRIARQLGM